MALSLLSLGVLGDGLTDDSARLNLALKYSSENRVSLYGTPGAVYSVGVVGRKTFLAPDGHPIEKEWAIGVPSGARVDFRGATIIPKTDADCVILSNANSATTGDIIDVRNVTIDGHGHENRTVPVVWFFGCYDSNFQGIHVQHSSYVAMLFARLRRCLIADLLTNDIVGQGVMLGGNSSDQIRDCRIGRIGAQDIRILEPMHHPGNPIFVGAVRCTISSLSASWCDGGIKLGPGCDGINIGSVDYSKGRTQNSGLKLQGEADAPLQRLNIGSVNSSECAGTGLLIDYATAISIEKYTGRRNGLMQLDPDLRIRGAGIKLSGVEIFDPGRNFLEILEGSGRIDIGRLNVNRSYPGEALILAASGGDGQIHNYRQAGVPRGGVSLTGSRTKVRMPASSRSALDRLSVTQGASLEFR